MNLKKIISIILFCTLFLCACDKENEIDNNIDFPVTLYAQTIGFTVKKNGNQFLFYSPQMVIVKKEEINGMVRPLLKYTDELIPLPSYAAENTYVTSEVRVGYGSYKNLELSFLSYKRFRKTVYDGGTYKEEFVAGTLFNEFNEEAINTLQLGDTLAIQEYRVRFIAK